ncbi:unnamed protein product, partial [Ascophyllum nodosum]
RVQRLGAVSRRRAGNCPRNHLCLLRTGCGLQGDGRGEERFRLLPARSLERPG